MAAKATDNLWDYRGSAKFQGMIDLWAVKNIDW